MLMLIKRASDTLMPAILPLIAVDRNLARRAAEQADMVPPPIFVIGPPRSGTTILVQRLLNNFRFTYTSNADSVLFTLPVLADHLTAKPKVGGIDRDHGESSEFGYIKGPWSVSEAGSMMRYFLDDPDNGKRISHFRGAVTDASLRSKRPYLTKNTLNALRLRAILRAFPNAFLIRTQRERESNARSILKMRRSRGGEHIWAGPAPTGWQSITHREPIEQARWQINAIHAQIDSDLATANHDAFPVLMEEFIDTPVESLSKIAESYQNASGFELTPTMSSKLTS